MASLLAGLGAVCGDCSTFNEPGVGLCSRCGRDLEIGFLLTDGTGPQPPPKAHLEGDTDRGPVARRAAAGDPTARVPAPRPPGATPAAPPRSPDPTARALEGGRVQGTPAPQGPTRVPPTEAPRAEAPPRGTAIRRPGIPPLAGGPCPRCGHPNPAAIHFCPSCGARLGRGLAPQLPLHPGSVQLTLLRGMGAALSSHPLSGAETRIGRTVGEIRFPADATLGALAATLRFEEGRLRVRDEGASVFVRIRQPEILQPGAFFAVGDQLLRFSGPVEPPRPVGNGPAIFGSPLPQEGHLLRIESILLGGAPARAWVRQAPLRLGRAIGDILLLDDPFVSARHCELDVGPDGRVVLRDLGSSNGTFLQIPPKGDWELLVGDTLRIGRNILRVDQVSP